MIKLVNGIQIIFSDLYYLMNTNSEGDINVVYNGDAISSALANILLTNKGERVMLPTFGANLKGLLFENFTDSFQQMVASQVKTEIEAWDNRITVASLQFNQDKPSLSLYVTLSYIANGLEELQQTTVKV